MCVRIYTKVHHRCIYFLIEQNARAALQVSDYGYILKTGEVVLEGPGDELTQNDDVRKTYLEER